MSEIRQDCYAGIDLGGTKIAIALGNAGGQIHARSQCATQAERGPDDVLQRVADELSRTEATAGIRASSLGLGLPGLVDPATGTSLFLPNLPGNWKGVAAGPILHELTSRNVYVLNDARMATLGEHVFGRHGGHDLIVLTLGTGIGGGLVVNDKLVLGRFGAAGEIGHQTIDAEGPVCNCGNRGCLEAIASGPALAAAGATLMRQGNAPHLLAITGGDPALVNPRHMAEAARQGDSAVREAMTRAASWIGTGIANAVTITGIERVVLLGGLTGLGDLLLNPVRETVRARIGMFPSDGITVSFSQLGDNTAVLGGIALAAQREKTL